MPRVWNKRTEKPPPDAVYVGRSGPWGNYSHRLVGVNRSLLTDEQLFKLHSEAVDDFKAGIEAREEYKARIRQELAGKDLVCWCTPLPCHADLLFEIANGDNLAGVVAVKPPPHPDQGEGTQEATPSSTTTNGRC